MFSCALGRYLCHNTICNGVLFTRKRTDFVVKKLDKNMEFCIFR